MTNNFKDEVYSLLAYVISSASGCVKEPKLYGPFRLIDTAERVINLLSEQSLLSTAALDEVAKRIETDKLLLMNDEEGFVKMLQDVSGMMAEIINEE